MPRTAEPPGANAMKTRRIPLFACQECGRAFYSTRAAERASFGDDGCPGCGGSDIDIHVPAAPMTDYHTPEVYDTAGARERGEDVTP